MSSSGENIAKLIANENSYPDRDETRQDDSD